jgi:hypothetical protein
MKLTKIINKHIKNIFHKKQIETWEEITEKEFIDFLEIHDHEFGGEYAYFPTYWPIYRNSYSLKCYRVQPYYNNHMKECKRI